MVFNAEYSIIYDALYKDKDYEAECDFIETLFCKHSYRPTTILDIGCGTGGHALILAKRGYRVTGIDRSDSMLDIAKTKAKDSGLEIEFIKGDLTNISIDRKFDAIICMFAVMSYQISNSAVAAVCRLAKESIAPEGSFMFDCWHGSAVLLDRPDVRIKEITLDNNERIIRFTEPEIEIINHTVKVNFRIWRIKNNKFTETHEVHRMRFLFPQEIKYFLEVAGFQKVDIYPFLGLDRELTEEDWNMMVVGRMK